MTHVAVMTFILGKNEEEKQDSDSTSEDEGPNSKRPAVQYGTGKKSFKHKKRLEKAMKVRKKQKKIKRRIEILEVKKEEENAENDEHGWESASLSEEADKGGDWVEVHHSCDEEQQEISKKLNSMPSEKWKSEV
ncbi:Protein SDA1 like protein [Myotis davidii]|uniref:Protein SDA1 like protein n=1 Tax=Myotis davidii TaxID=225400 RepID=L5ML87_MYODS|nr:Protein SDA1 like protein [Myotis davidii]